MLRFPCNTLAISRVSPTNSICLICSGLLISIQHHGIGLLDSGVNPAGLFAAEDLAAIVAAAQVDEAGLELGRLCFEGCGLPTQLGIGEQTLQFVVEGEVLIAGVAAHLGLVAIRGQFLHQHFLVALGGTAVGAKPVAAALHRFGRLAQLALDQSGEGSASLFSLCGSDDWRV